MSQSQLSVIWEPPCDPDKLREQLANTFELRFVSLGRLQHYQPEQYTLVDANLKETTKLPELKEWLSRRPKHGKVICAVDKASHIETTRAFAIGANDVVQRPLRRKDLLARLWGEFTELASGSAFSDSPAASAAVDALQNIFSAACVGGQLNQAAVNAAGERVVAQIGDQGLGSWLGLVRKHHSQTYQHCLIVTGVAVAFAQHLGFSQADQMRLSFAGMLHDLGKARIPLAILEKPGPLDEDERAVMRNHPQYGVDALEEGSRLPSEMLDMVLHHHEYLDGSGYPHGLKAPEISDLVRVMTISDVFGALIEHRSYKPPMSGKAAYQILLDMGQKLDQDLVRVFEPVSRLGQHS